MSTPFKSYELMIFFLACAMEGNNFLLELSFPCIIFYDHFNIIIIIIIRQVPFFGFIFDKMGHKDHGFCKGA